MILVTTNFGWEPCTTAIEKAKAPLRIDGLVRREPSAAYHEHNPGPVGIPGLKDIERQRRTELAAINHVLDTGEGWRIRGLRAGLENCAEPKKQEYFFTRRCQSAP